jgi:hypothetical protein
MAFKVPEKYRVTRGYQGTPSNCGNYGMFYIPRPGKNAPLKIVASDGLSWEHVSVSLPDRTPTWEEMCLVKDLFWDEDDVVIQYHPAKDQYVNLHPNCLHLWRPVDQKIPVPHKALVGF